MKETTLATKAKSTTASKHVDVIARYFLKAALAIIYVLVNGGGKKYLVTIHANGNVSCVEAETGDTCEGCKYGHVCYHKQAARKAHMAEHDSVAGFSFVVPESKKEVVSQEKLYEMTAEELQVELSAMKLAQLKAIARERRVNVSGAKAKVVVALVASFAEAHVTESASKVSAKCPVNVPKCVEIVPTECPQIAPKECVFCHLDQARIDGRFCSMECKQAVEAIEEEMADAMTLGPVEPHALDRNDEPDEYPASISSELAVEDEPFSEDKAEGWTQQELSTRLSWEAFQQEFDPNYATYCYA